MVLSHNKLVQRNKGIKLSVLFYELSSPFRVSYYSSGLPLLYTLRIALQVTFIEPDSGVGGGGGGGGLPLYLSRINNATLNSLLTLYAEHWFSNIVTAK